MSFWSWLSANRKAAAREQANAIEAVLVALEPLVPCSLEGDAFRSVCMQLCSHHLPPTATTLMKLHLALVQGKSSPLVKEFYTLLAIAERKEEL